MTFTPLDSIPLDSKHLTAQEHLTGQVDRIIRIILRVKRRKFFVIRIICVYLWYNFLIMEVL